MDVKVNQALVRHSVAGRGGDAAAMAASTPVIFGRRDEWGHRIHMSGKNNFRTSMLRPCGEHVRAQTFDQHSPAFEATPPQFAAEKISHHTFIWSDGFDVDQPAGERKQVHADRE